MFPRVTWKTTRKYPVWFPDILKFRLCQESSSSTVWPDSMQKASGLLNGMILELFYVPFWSKSTIWSAFVICVTFVFLFLCGNRNGKMLLILRKESSSFSSVETKFLSIPKCCLDIIKATPCVHGFLCIVGSVAF